MSTSGWEWWRDGVIYQIYPRSWADSNGDGIGDLGGIISHLDYLQWLGIDGIWLTPITVSPDRDLGYDVADYCAVQPVLGALETVDELIREAGSRDIRIILDLVPNHTSDQHPWFVDSRSSRTSRLRDWYIWRDPKPDGSPPNSWQSAFGGPAWMFDEQTSQYYLHSFDPTQPDLNWWNPQVRETFDGIIRFWFDRAVAGFRIDVAHDTIKDRQLRDSARNANLPEMHEILRHWRSVADSYRPPRILIGETSVLDVARMATYYGQGDELHLAFNFPFLHAPFEAPALQAVVKATEAAIPAHSWPIWTASNHDVSRFATRWCAGDPDRVRCALLILLLLRGTPVLYYGDEIGMTDTPIAFEDLQDVVGKRHWPRRRGRDPARTPMHWTSEPGAGFTRPGVRPWLPLGDFRASNVADQQRNLSSVLSFVHHLLALRRESSDLRRGAYESLPTPAGTWAWRRGRGTVVALNLSDDEVGLEGFAGWIRAGTRRDREGERLGDRVALHPWEGVVAVTD